jgi:photosystem II stability/assembly factor-like uncharacterized protein
MSKTKVIALFCMAVFLNKLTAYAVSTVRIDCGITISAISVTPKHPEVVYAMNARDGLYKSTDSGGSWNVVVAVESHFLTIDPEYPQIIYIVERKSIDGGKTWDTMRNGLPPSSVISRVIIYPNNTKIMYALTNRGSVYKSINGGESWTATGGDNLGTCRALAMDPNNSNILYGHFERRSRDIYGLYRGEPAIVGGIHKSVDGGTTWNLLLPALEITELAVDPNNSEIVYAVNMRHGVYRSLDGGERWNRVNHGLPERIRISIFAFDPLNSETIYVVTDSGFFKSVDRGYNWRNISNRLNVHTLTLAINPQDSSIMYAGTRGDGVLKTTDGGITWHPANNGIPALPSCPW